MIPGDIKLLVGLGNPGSKYKTTRHNIGFMALERLAQENAVSFKKHTRIEGLLGEIGFGTKRVRLLMPNTYMNESGRSIRSAMNWFDLEIEQLLVLVDDMDLPLGKLRLRTKGGSGGHNGLKSTISHLGTENFNRLRIGIGAPIGMPEERRANTVSHVLGVFSKSETLLVENTIKQVITGINIIQEYGLEKASNQLNSYQATKLEK
ncbi:aminoacyl-tRNA hydrolase [Prochlorococcus sp. MIT 1300]|uniref:aminoacyl-tRNA hydrolase n=1 Tax=Prochlorococcus sp. MIT 1300 TaxID=3096218 RepID=UPI002A74E395|nr:aminoacyl-tRNA hydrolase [Prochlorococcus sp. MIT 1300]